MKKNLSLFFRLLIVFFISILISLYLFETYLIFFEKKFIFRNIQKEYFDNTGKKYDFRTKYEIYGELKKINEKISLNITPISHLNKTNINIFPLSGISNVETIHCNENGYYSIYNSDRYGFNNPDTEWDSNEIEYMLIGDSYTHGACVNRPHDIGSVLRNLSNKKVLNLGFTANGPLIQFATLKEYLNSKIKKVIWIYYAGNDLSDLNREVNNKILNRYLKEDNFYQSLILKQNEIDEINKKTLKNRINSETHNLEKNSRTKYKILKFIQLDKTKDKFRIIFSKNDYRVENINLFLEILMKAQKLVKDNNSEFYFVYLPDFYRYQDEKYPLDEEKIIEKLVNKLNIPIINIHKLFFKNKDQLKYYPFNVRHHYTKEGYEEITKTIYENIKDK